MSAYTKVFSGPSELEISKEINEYMENCEYCDDPVRITAMTIMDYGFQKIVIVAFEKV